MGKAVEKFMRAYPDRWLDEENIRGRGDDGQREGGIPLDQEGAYWRLCLTQFRQPDGYLPNRRAFLCDSVVCPVSDYEKIVIPVISRFFRTTKDGSRLYNLRVRSEWEDAHKKSAQAAENIRVRWEAEKRRLSLSNTGVDTSVCTDEAYKSKRESKSKREKESSASRGRSALRTPKGRAEYDRLVAEPEILTLAERWVSTLGGTLSLGLLQAVRDLLATGYDSGIATQAMNALQAAAEHPAAFNARSQSIWCHEHNHLPGYVLRPGIVEKLASEYQQYQRDSAQTETPATEQKPRALRERDDVAMTPEQIAAIRAGRAS